MKTIHIPRRFVKTHWGGTETVVLEICKRLVAHEHQAEIFCSNALESSSFEIMDAIRVHRYSYFYPYFGLNEDAKAQLDRKGGNLFSFSLMRSLLQQTNLDLIHLHTGKRLGGIARYVAAKKRIPYVISLHGGISDVPQHEAASWTEPTRNAFEWGKILGWWVGSRRVMDDAAAIICVGKQESIITQKNYPNKKVVYLPNGVDPEHFAEGNGAEFREEFRIPKDAFVILNVGRIDPQKNQLMLIESMPSFSEIQPNTHLLLIGPPTNDEYHDSLMRTIKRMDLDNRVTLIPGLPSDSRELVNAFHCADLFVLPSLHEPFGIVILEAWASRLPVIANEVGGIPAFLEDKRTGLLFNCNQPSSLVNAFRYAINNPEHMDIMAEEGRMQARFHYSWDSIYQRLMHIYEEAVRENPLRK